MNAERFDVVDENVAELILANLSEKGPLAAERGQPRNRVGTGPARHFDRGRHLSVKLVGALVVDQRHAAFLDTIRDQEFVVRIRNHVHQRIADARHVIHYFGHDPLRVFWMNFGVRGRSIGIVRHMSKMPPFPPFHLHAGLNCSGPGAALG